MLGNLDLSKYNPGSVVSSVFSYENRADQKEEKLPIGLIEHELIFLKTRETATTIVAIAAIVLAFLSVMGVISSGMILLGALFTTAGVAALYACLCRLAETGLRDRILDTQKKTVEDRRIEEVASQKISTETSLSSTENVK